MILGSSVNSIDDTQMRHMGQKFELPDILACFGKYFTEAPALCSHACNFVALRQPIPISAEHVPGAANTNTNQLSNQV